MNLFIFDELFSSSSESSESDEEILDVIDENNYENRPRRKKARVPNFIENVVYEYDDKEFQENFRYVRKINLLIYTYIYTCEYKNERRRYTF